MYGIKTGKDKIMGHPELEFFNNLAGELVIELTIPPKPIANLENVQASPDARVKSLKLRAEVFNPDTKKFRNLAQDELGSVAFRGKQISLRGESGDAVTHNAPNGEFFTVRELLQVVEETERRIRGQSEWFGGVDVHHVFFEGIELGGDGVWEIRWGS